MSDSAIIFLLCIGLAVMACIIIYQQIAFRAGIQAKLRKISGDLESLLDTDSDEKVMIFTDNPALMELAAQINRLLEDRQRVRVNFRRAQASSKKMLSNISHDIKTPMTVILGYLEIIRLGGDASPAMLAKVEQKAQRVMELINQFFTLAKLEAGDTKIELGRINVNEACRENILDFYELLTSKNFQVDINIPDEVLYARASGDALQRIMFNLISNGIRYGSDGKYLGIFLTADSAHVYIRVTDRGKGIPGEFAANVFDRLFTMDDARSSQIQGNGLGLTIARSLARQMGGDITLESRPDIQTDFTVILQRIAY